MLVFVLVLALLGFSLDTCFSLVFEFREASSFSWVFHLIQVLHLSSSVGRHRFSFSIAFSCIRLFAFLSCDFCDFCDFCYFCDFLLLTC